MYFPEYWSDLSQIWYWYLPLDPQCVYQISARLKHAAIQERFMQSVQKEEKTKKFLLILLTHILEMAWGIFLKF